jgi:hypothetical protein
MAGEASAIFSTSQLPTSRHEGEQMAAKDIKQGQSLIKGLTHKFAPFDL